MLPFVQKQRLAFANPSAPLVFLLIKLYIADHFLPSLICLSQNFKDEAANAVEQFREAESEAKALRTMTHRMILTHEEMVIF